MIKKINQIDQQKQIGFSLVELLVVIAIIATLTAIIMPNLMGAREKARDSQRIQDLSSMKTALRTYYNDNQAYPTPRNVAGSPIGTGFSGYYPSIQGLGFTYGYYQPVDTDSFILCVNLEARGGPEAITSQGKCGVPFSGISVCNQGVNVTGNGVYTICAN